MLWNNKNYLLFTISYMNMFGVYSVLTAVIDNLVKQYEFTSTDSSIFGISFTISGVVGAFIVSVMIDKYKNYIKVYRILCIISLIMCVLFMVTFPTGNRYLVAINLALFGFFIVPIQPLGLSFCCEISHPVSEAMSNGIILLSAEMVAFSFTYLASALIGIDSIACVGLFVA